MLARVAVAVTLVVTTAHANPRLMVTPELAARLDRAKAAPRVAPALHRATHIDAPARGLDGTLALFIARASDSVGKLVGLHGGMPGGVGAFLDVENIVSAPGPASPRVFVLGLQLGAAPAVVASPLTTPLPDFASGTPYPSGTP